MLTANAACAEKRVALIIGNSAYQNVAQLTNPAGHPAEPLVTYQINRQLSGWNLPPLVMRAFGAHCQVRTYAPCSKDAYSMTSGRG
jgi:hypothetical protein